MLGRIFFRNGKIGIIRRVRRRVRRVRRQSAASKLEYAAQCEAARALVTERLAHFAAEYARLDPALVEPMTYRRIAIRNQRSRWGSCSSKKNLNFNYRIVKLSPELRDYIVVHELCHLKELHHGRAFWDLMKRTIPNAGDLHHQARTMRIS